MTVIDDRLYEEFIRDYYRWPLMKKFEQLPLTITNNTCSYHGVPCQVVFVSKQGKDILHLCRRDG